MVTPFPDISRNPEMKSKDNYNFYHSQLVRQIDCMFGMLVQKWGILRMAMPHNILILGVTEMVNALAKLRNFCISESDIPAEVMTRDVTNIINIINGFVEMMVDYEDIPVIPTDLNDLVHHFTDVPCSN